MSLNDPKFSAVMEAAQQQIVAAVAAAVGEAIDSMPALMRVAATARESGRLAYARTQLMTQRDPLLANFRAALRQGIDDDLNAKTVATAAKAPAKTDWEKIGLVEEDRIEERISVERIGSLISHECDVEARELSGYMSNLLRHGNTDPERNPLRGFIIGRAMHSALETTIKEPMAQKELAMQIGKPLATGMREVYRNVVADLRLRGIKPVGLMAKPIELSQLQSGAGTPPRNEESLRNWERSAYGRTAADALDSLRRWEASIVSGGPVPVIPPPLDASESPDPESSPALLERLMRGGMPGSAAGGGGSGEPDGRSGFGGSSSSRSSSVAADNQLMGLLRRLTGNFDSSRGGYVDSGGLMAPDSGGPMGHHGEGGNVDSGRMPLAPPNLIRVHRQELEKYSAGHLDHMVIEVVSSLFDQILSDPQVPPQMARQIARLQLPVLRVALRDPSLFASRRHPVRRFVNRVSSLGSAMDDFENGAGKELLDRVRLLVKEIVDGDFEQISLYDGKLADLEKFSADQARAELEASGAANTLRAKEREWNQFSRFSQQMASMLKPVSIPPYLKEFISRVWALVILTAATRDGVASTETARYRRAGIDLAISVLPKRSIDDRNKFLQTLPQLMATLNEGMALIDASASTRNDFLGHLISGHAGSLKSSPLSELDRNLLVKRIQSVFAIPIPDADDPTLGPPVLTDEVQDFEQRFSVEEAHSLGLIQESAIDWESTVDIPLDIPAPVATRADGSTAIPPATVQTVQAFAALDQALPEPPADEEPAPPAEGPQLREHLQVGFSYQLLLDGAWEKVRLTYMGPGRNFFLFTHGAKDRRSISMTVRMIDRLCAARRMKAFERSTLIERATERARAQLATLH